MPGAALAALLLCLALGRPSLAGDCPRPSTAAEAQLHVDALESAFRARDRQGVLDAEQRLRESVSCAGEPLTPTDSAAVHRAVGLGRGLVGDRDGALRSFRAALTLEPGVALDPQLVPEGHPILELYRAAGLLPPGPTTPAFVPDSAQELRVDGSEASAIPTERASVVQRLGSNGMPAWSGYHADGGLPEGSGLLPTPPAAPPGTTPEPRRPRVALVAGAGAALLGSGALYALSALSMDEFQHGELGEDPVARLNMLRRVNNAEFYGAVTLGTVAVGLGVTSFLEIRW